MVDPGGVVQVPANGLSEPFVKADALAPAEFGLEARAVDGVAAVVAGAVFDVGDEPAQARGIEVGFFGDKLDEPLEEADVLPLVLAANVVGAAALAFAHDGPDRLVVVLDIEPVADVPPIAVDREGLAFEHVEDHEGDEFFGELIGAVVVRAVGEGERQAIGVVVGLGEVVARGLAGGIGRARVIGGFFGEVALLSQRAKDLVGAHMMEEHIVAQGAVGVFPGIAGHIEEGVGAHDIGAHKGFRAEDGAVDVAFGGEVDNGVDAVLGKEALDEGAVADVTLYKHIAALAAGFFRRLPIARLDIGEVFEVAGIGEGVEIDDAPRKIWAPEEPVDEVRADEAGAAGDEDGGK